MFDIKKMMKLIEIYEIGNFEGVDNMSDEVIKTSLEIDWDCIAKKKIIVRNNTLNKEIQIRVKKVEKNIREKGQMKLKKKSEQSKQ